MRQPARKLTTRDAAGLNPITELEPIDIEGSVSRANAIELEPIDIVGSRSADVEPFDGGVRMPDGSESAPRVRRDDGVSTMLPDWVPSWATEVTGQPVRGMGGTVDYEVPEWLGEIVADSEGQMPESVMGAAAAMAPNVAFPPYMLYRQFAGQEPTADERTGSPMAALAGMADAGAVPLNAASRFAGADNFVGLFDDEAGAEYRREMQTTQRQNPGSFAVGEAGAMALQNFIPSAAAGRGASTAARVGYSALEGAAYGGMEGMARSNAPTLSGQLQDALPGAIGGGVLGGVLGGAGSRAERRAAEPVDQRAVEEALDQAALERLAQAGGSQSLSSRRMRMVAPGATPRDQIASARRTVDRMREYGAFDGFLPPGPEVVGQRVGAQRERALANMDRIGSRMETETVDPTPLLTHMEDRIASLERIPGAENEANSMRQLLARFEDRVQGGDLSMRDLQEWKSYWNRRTDPNASSVSETEARDVYRAITENMQEGVAAVDPQLGRDYQQARHDEFIGRGFDEMQGHLAMDAARLRKFSLSDYMTGLEGFREGIVPGVVALAANRGLRRNEHGLAAMSLERTARRLQEAPQRFGRQAAMLQAALKRGPQAFAAALYIAQQNDAAVRAAMAEEEDVAGMRERATEAVPTMDAAIEEDINSIPTMDDL